MTQPTEEEPESKDAVQQGEEILRRYIGEERLEQIRSEPRQRVFHVFDPASEQEQSQTPEEAAPDEGVLVRVSGQETAVLQVELSAELRKIGQLSVSDLPPMDVGDPARLLLRGPSPALVEALSTIWRWYMEQREERGREVKISLLIRKRRELHLHELDLAEARTRLEELKRNV